jgi:Tol biopolymer transport system component
MNHQTHHYFIGLVIVFITLLLAACGGSDQLTYQVTGSASQAEVTYSDAEGKSKTETVTLPWKTGFSVGGNADFSLAADNTTGHGNISCVVLLNEKELGHADANYYAACQGSFKKSGNSLSTNFSSRRDVLPDGTAAGPQATPTPVPPTATPVPSPTPDLAADFVAFTNKKGSASLRYPPGWTVVEDGNMLAAISDKSLEKSFLRDEDYSQPAGFVVGLVGQTSDHKSDDPSDLVKEWLAQVENDGWHPQPVGALHISTNGTVRRASREYTGNKDGQELYFTITGIVNGGGAGIFVGGRTGTAPQEHGALATAVLNTIKIEYIDPSAVTAPLKPTAAAAAPTRAATKPFANQPIVFASDRDGDSEIYVNNIGDKNITRLTDNDVYDGEPTWSPDGKKIAFVSKRDGNYEIYTMNPDGSEVTRLTDDPANDYSPAWSPNSQVITFMTERDGNPDLYMMRADGSDAALFLASKGKDLSPTWSYTSPELAFVSDQAKEGVFDLYITDTQNKVRRITHDIGNLFTPNWSPNGRYIAFAADNGKNVDIYIIKPDGTGLQQVTDDKARDFLPKWSPDSNYIMFVSERDGNPDIYITDGAGDVQRIISNKAMDTSPGWGPMKK